MNARRQRYNALWHYRPLDSWHYEGETARQGIITVECVVNNQSTETKGQGI